MTLWRNVSAVLLAVSLAGCSAPADPPSGTAGLAGYGAADVALMDTGPYATTPTRPFGAVGADLQGRAMLEAHRIAEYTVGPWQADMALTAMPGLMLTNLISPYPNVEFLRSLEVLPPAVVDAVAKHRMVAGFSSLRLGGAELPLPESLDAPVRPGLQTVVIAFPDPPAAVAAATDMADRDPGPSGGSNPQRVEVPGHPDARAVSYEVDGDSTVVHSFTPVGTVVLVQFAQAPTDTFITTGRFSPRAISLVQSALNKQKSLIKDYTPTPADKMADLPLDASGWLLARTLTTPDNRMPRIVGAWKPRAWLHFEDDPINAAALFADAGVDWVAQRAATVYQTRNADAAETMLERFTAAMSAMPSVAATSATPGLPRARCFRRTEESPASSSGAAPPGSPESWLRVGWPVKCAAATERWVFTVYAETVSDAQQRISAQYRILAGR